MFYVLICYPTYIGRESLAAAKILAALPLLVRVADAPYDKYP